MTLQSLVSPSSRSSLKLETGKCAGTAGNLGAPCQLKSRRQLNSVLQGAALIMEQICSFMRFSSSFNNMEEVVLGSPAPAFFPSLGFFF